MPKYDVFLSYNHSDEDAVEVLALRLKEEGVSVFFAKWDLVPGEPWHEAIEEALEESRTAAIFLGPRGIGRWENEEMWVALAANVRDRTQRVIPVLLPGAPDPSDRLISRVLRRRTWVDFRAGLDDGREPSAAFNRLLQGVRGEPLGTGPGAEGQDSWRDKLARWIARWNALQFLKIAGLVLVFLGFVVALLQVTQTWKLLFPGPTATPAVTPTHTPMPKAQKLHYAIILDASARMKAGFGEQNKWNAAQEVLERLLLEGLPSRANYGLFVLGGDGRACERGCWSRVPLGMDARDDILNAAPRLEPSGKAALYDAVVTARKALEDNTADLAGDPDQVIIMITGGGDECEDADVPWDHVLWLFKNMPDGLKGQAEIIILADEEVDERTDAFVTTLHKLEVHVDAPTDPADAIESADRARERLVQTAATREPAAYSAEETAIAAARLLPPTATRTPTPIETSRPATRPATPTPRPTTAPTRTPTRAPPATRTRIPTRTTTVEPTATPAPTHTDAPAPTATHTVTSVPTPTHTATTAPTSTHTATIVPTPTDTPTAVPTPTDAATTVPTATSSPTATPTSTLTPTSVPASTSTPTSTPTSPPTATLAPPTATATPPSVAVHPLPPQNEVYAQGCWLDLETVGFETIESNGGTLSAQLVADGQTGPGLELVFDVSNQPFNYSGWQVLLGEPDQGIDLSSYSSLTFSIRGQAGGEQTNVWLMMPDADGGDRFFKALLPTIDWQTVAVPLAQFASGTKEGEQVDLRKIHKLQFVFEWYDAPTSGTVHVDDLCIE